MTLKAVEILGVGDTTQLGYAKVSGTNSLLYAEHAGYVKCLAFGNRQSALGSILENVSCSSLKAGVLVWNC